MDANEFSITYIRHSHSIKKHPRIVIDGKMS